MAETEALARFVSTITPAQIPIEASVAARRAFLDTLGVMLAGTREDCARIVSELVRARESRPVATVVGRGYQTSPDAAALVNGVAAHALDYDDVNSAMTGHPSVPLVPTVLAIGEQTGASGADVLNAFIVGFEIEVRLGRSLGRSHYARGWHATATLGVLGAAAAACRLYGYGVDVTQTAMGIATSMACGSRQNFGTMTKPLHPGYAAQNGIVAAQLAGRGFTADTEIIEAPLGFLNLYSPDGDSEPRHVTEGLGQTWQILRSGISVKNYPCCFGTHRAIEASLDLMSGEGVSAAEIEQIDVLMPRGSGAPLIHSRPVTGLQGKFSMEYCVAAALLDGRVGLDTFEDDSVMRPTAQDMLRRVAVHDADVDCAPAEGFSEVTLHVKGGRQLSRRVDDPRGSPQFPLSVDELSAKYRDCAERVIGGAATIESLHSILEIDRLDSVSGLMEILSRPASVLTA